VVCRWFTPDSAREALSHLRRPAETMARACRVLEALKPTPVPPDGPVAPAYYHAARALDAAVRAVEAAGAIVRDPRGGILDFPARRAGHPVLLRWALGEPGLAVWIEAGPSGERRPVDEDGPWEPPPAAPGAV
jgi:hypothetical protein